MVHIEQLAIAPAVVDSKNPVRFSNAVEEELDTEVRRYNPGDNKKRIHWKASAKANELLSRQYHQKPKSEVILFMDLAKVREDELKAVIIEDKIIESTLAIANYYASRATHSHVIYDMDGIKQVSIHTKDDFNIFYRACVNIRFDSTTSIDDLLARRLQRGDGGYSMWWQQVGLQKSFILEHFRFYLEATVSVYYLLVMIQVI